MPKAKSLPAPAEIPIPLNHWFNDVRRVDDLRSLLESEAFKTAAATLKEVAGPTHATVSSDSAENSHRHAWYAGYRDAFTDLQKLTVPRGPNQQPTQPEEWKHIQTQP